MTDTTDFDGCNRECRKAGKHTLRWGGCEHAPKPEPTVSMSKVYTDPVDGYPSIGYDSYTVPQLGELITAGLRASDLPVNGDDLVDVGLVAAHAIVHRNDPAAPAAAVVPAADRAAPAEPVCTCGGPQYETTLPSGTTYEEHRVDCALMQDDEAAADQTAEELASIAVNAGRALQDEKRHYEIACQENALLRATVERVRRLHDALDAETDLTSPDQEITRGAAARKIAAALDGWTDPAEVRHLATEAAAVPAVGVAADTTPAETQPRRGDQFEAWLKTQRDEHPRPSHAWFMVDCVLDRYRLHADMGVPLTGHVCEARVVGDCECLEPGPVVPAQPGNDTKTREA